MNAFDKSLQGLDTSEQGKVVQTVTSGGLDMVVKGGAKWVGGKGGLYASFVRGEGLGGTITPDTEDSGSGMTSRSRSEEPLGKKRRMEQGRESKEERRKRKAAKRAGRIQGSASEVTPDLETEAETKEDKKVRRAAEKAMKAQEAAVEEEAPKMEGDETIEKVETKEERRERKHQKKLLKEAKQKALEEASCSKSQSKKRRKD